MINTTNNDEFVRQVVAGLTRGGLSVTQKDVKTILEYAGTAIVDIMKKGEAVKPFKGTGITLCGVVVPEKEHRIPSGEVVTTPEHIAPKAKFAPSVKEALR